MTKPRKDLEEYEKTYQYNDHMPNMTLEEVGTPLKKMETRNDCGPDQISIKFGS